MDRHGEPTERQGGDGYGSEPPWPVGFPVSANGRVAVGLPVWSRSGTIEGRTSGGRARCRSTGCPGWFIWVRWETGQPMQICSQGWTYDPTVRTVRVTAGGEISARFVSPPPLGTPPLPREEWPDRSALARKSACWRVDASARQADG